MDDFMIIRDIQSLDIDRVSKRPGGFMLFQFFHHIPFFYNFLFSAKGIPPLHSLHLIYNFSFSSLMLRAFILGSILILRKLNFFKRSYFGQMFGSLKFLFNLEGVTRREEARDVCFLFLGESDCEFRLVGHKSEAN